MPIDLLDIPEPKNPNLGQSGGQQADANVTPESRGTPVSAITYEDAFPPKPKPAVFLLSENRIFAEANYDGSVWVDWAMVDHLSQMPMFALKDGKVIYFQQSATFGIAKMLRWSLEHGFKLGRSAMKAELDAELSAVEAEYRADPLMQETADMAIEPTTNQNILSQAPASLIAEPAATLKDVIRTRLFFGIPVSPMLEACGIALALIVVNIVVKPILIAVLACVAVVFGYITWKAMQQPKSLPSKRT